MEKIDSQQFTLDKIFFSTILGFCLGIILNSFFVLDFYIYITLFFGIASFALGVLSKHNSQKFFCGAIILLSMLFGNFRMEISKGDIYTFEKYLNQKITLVGTINDSSQKTYNQQSLLTTTNGQKILIYTQKYPYLNTGDKISVSGILSKPKNFITNQGNEFDYISYLYKDDIVYVIPNGKAQIILQGKANFLSRIFSGVKNWFIFGYQKILSPEDADLMGGLTLGAKENISNEFRDSLVETSTIHIIALSGYNVTIVANFLRGLLIQIPFVSAQASLVFGGFGIIFFVLMTGGQSSAIRAGIMALIALFGRGTGRTYDAFRALLFAGFLMIIWNPKYLVYDVSFQLSFLATLGMIFLTPIFFKTFKKIPENLFQKIPLRETLATTLGAQTAVVPFIVYKMGVFSLVSIPANMLVLPVVPLAMAVGTVAGILGNISIIFATPFAFITHLLLQYIIYVINFFASLPFSYIAFEKISILLCVLMYGTIFFWVYKNLTIIL